MNPINFFCFCGVDDLTLSSFSSAQGVGIGLYLGLAILQVVGSGGVADLSRRSQTLETTINSNNLHGLRQDSNRIKADLAKIEIALHSFSRQVFGIVLLLLLVCLGILTLTSLRPGFPTYCWSSYSILAYFLLLPVLLFVGSAAWIRKRCSSVRAAIKSCEKLVNQKLLGKGHIGELVD